MNSHPVLVHQEGSILIVVMVVLSLIGTMAGTMIYQTRLELRVQQRINTLTHLRGVARGGVHQFASALTTRVAESSNGPQMRWWRDEVPFRPIEAPRSTGLIAAGSDPAILDQADSSEGLVDEESRININTATPEQLMAFPGFSNLIAEEIVRYRQDLGGVGVSENTDPSVPPNEASNEGEEDEISLHYVNYPFHSLRALLAVEGVTEEILFHEVASIKGRLADYLTCCSSGKVNLNTAPHQVLVAVGFSPEEANVLLAERRSGSHFKDLSISETILPKIEEARWKQISPSLTVRSSTFPVLSQARSRAGDLTLTLHARVFLGERETAIVEWREI